MRLRRRVWLPLALLGVLALGAGMAFGLLMLLRSSAPGNENSSFITGLLPGAEERDESQFSESSPAPDSSTEPTQSPIPTPSIVPLVNRFHGQGDNLAVLVRYTRGSTFTLSLDTVTRTSEPPTIQHYEPLPGAPFSILRLVGNNGTALREYNFTMPTSGIGEALGGQAQVGITLDESTAYLVVDVPPNITIAQVQLVTPDGRVLDEESFSLQTKGQSRLQRFVASFTTDADAQTNSQFTIAVVNEIGAQNNVRSMAQTVRGITQIEPWATFSDQLNVVPIINTTTSLGCQTTSGGFPACNEGTVTQVVTNADVNANTIVVVSPQQCNCGFAGVIPSNIAVVGTNASSLLVAHELGHTVGKMADEYLTVATASFNAPNCFPSLSSCQQAIAPFAGQPGAQCSLGCNTASSFRTANRLMYNVEGPHGPFQQCFLGRVLARILGTTYDCPELGPSPSPSSSPGDFWGWFR